jgi:hypothetical protein
MSYQSVQWRQWRRAKLRKFNVPLPAAVDAKKRVRKKNPSCDFITAVRWGAPAVEKCVHRHENKRVLPRNGGRALIFRSHALRT